MSFKFIATRPCRDFCAALGIIGLASSTVFAASHSDAPLIKQDPQANITDVYAFVGTKFDDPGRNVLNVLVQTRPFSEPGDGVIYDRFADDALYSIHITDPASGETLTTYNFQFSDVNPKTFPGLKNADTILSYGRGAQIGPILDLDDARQNYTQSYTVSKVDSSSRRSTVIGEGIVPPPNVGSNTTPDYNDAVTGQATSGAADVTELDRYTRDAVVTTASGVVLFAGPREDGFYADIPAIFDLLDGRILDNDGDTSNGLGQDGGGVDGFKGFNVLAYGLQIPLDSLPSLPYVAFPTGPANGVGVYASVSRPRLTLRRSNGDPITAGPFVQVNRMGNPLLNEALIALADKDEFNRRTPTDDVAKFETYALNSELAVLINAVFGTAFEETGRVDLRDIFIPDVLRVNTQTGATRLAGQSGFSRLSIFGGDLLTGPSGAAAAGWPNGRRFGDDVIDIALTAIASGPDFSSVTLLGDNVNANDQLYHQVFPYAATPHAGPAVDQRQAP